MAKLALPAALVVKFHVLEPKTIRLTGESVVHLFVDVSASEGDRLFGYWLG
jgi:hypothetical protein